MVQLKKDDQERAQPEQVWSEPVGPIRHSRNISKLLSGSERTEVSCEWGMCELANFMS